MSYPTDEMVEGFLSTLHDPWPGDRPEDTLRRALHCASLNDPTLHAADTLAREGRRVAEYLRWLARDGQDVPNGVHLAAIATAQAADTWDAR